MGLRSEVGLVFTKLRHYHIAKRNIAVRIIVRNRAKRDYARFSLAKLYGYHGNSPVKR